MLQKVNEGLMCLKRYVLYYINAWSILFWNFKIQICSDEKSHI